MTHLQVGTQITLEGRRLHVLAAHVATGTVDCWCLADDRGERYRYVPGWPLVVVVGR